MKCTTSMHSYSMRIFAHWQKRRNHLLEEEIEAPTRSARATSTGCLASFVPGQITMGLMYLRPPKDLKFPIRTIRKIFSAVRCRTFGVGQLPRSLSFSEKAREFLLTMSSKVTAMHLSYPRVVLQPTRPVVYHFVRLLHFIDVCLISQNAYGKRCCSASCVTSHPGVFIRSLDIQETSLLQDGGALT